MNILKTFLSLTDRTYPHGSESELFHLLPEDIQTDEFGNKFIQIGESPTIIFTSHLDTATNANTEVIHVSDGDLVKTDGKSILGADDKAGVTIMLNMIEHKVPGLYYFFLGEEVGCVGSKKLSEKLKLNKIEGITKVISFDRRGYDSVITHQFSTRCCSDDFAKALAKALNDGGLSDYTNDKVFGYKPDPTGLYTDSAQFVRIYPECTNISVGYRYEHTFTEQQDIKHLEKLANVCLYIDWESLPISRDPSVIEYDRSNYGYYWGEYDDYYGGGSSYWDRQRTPITYVNTESKELERKKAEQTDKLYFLDEKYRYVSCVESRTLSKKIVSVDFDTDRIADEKLQILELLQSLEVEYTDVTWDGLKLTVIYEFHKTEHSREDLEEFIPDLNFWKEEVERWDGIGNVSELDNVFE